jgi:GTPase SAR1 family protein
VQQIHPTLPISMANDLRFAVKRRMQHSANNVSSVFFIALRLLFQNLPKKLGSTDQKQKYSKTKMKIK